MDNVVDMDPLMDRAVEMIVASYHDDKPIILPPDSPLAVKIRELDPEVDVFDRDFLDAHSMAMTPAQREITCEVALLGTEEPSEYETLWGLGPKVRYYRFLTRMLEGIDAGDWPPPWTLPEFAERA